MDTNYNLPPGGKTTVTEPMNMDLPDTQAEIGVDHLAILTHIYRYGVQNIVTHQHRQLGTIII